MAEETTVNPEDIAAKVTVRSVKGGQFRVVHADGFLLQRDLRNGVRITFYNDRIAFDETVVNTTTKDGKTTTNSAKDFSNEFERELEVEIAITFPTLGNLHNEIEQFVEWIRADMKQSKADQPESSPQQASK